MRRKNIIIEWSIWQYKEAPEFLLKAWGNYLKFASSYFSVFFLLKTLFAPWRRYNWSYPKNFNIAEFFNTLISNFVSRVLGAFMRIILIFAGIIFQLFTVMAGAAVLIFWLAAPILIIGGIAFVFIF